MVAPWLSAVALVLAAVTAGAQTDSAPQDFAAPPADAEKSVSGLAWKVLQAGASDAHPDGNDLISTHLRGWTAQGAQFQDSRDDGKPVVFNLGNVFPAWTEAVLPMVVGEKRRVWIPEHLAPKDSAAGLRGAAVFDIELLAIRRIPNPPEQLTQPPPDAQRNGAGSFSRVVEAGNGDTRPSWDGQVLLRYTGWTTDGKTFDSTYVRNRPTAFPLEKVMPAFSEVVQQMVVGETRQMWIPANLAARNWPGSPGGQLIFEVTLDSILPQDTLQSGPIEKPDSN